MSLTVAFADKTNYLELVGKLFESKFKIEKKIVLDDLDQLNNLMIDDVGIFIEFPYVDKHYRDSYYTYFSTKHHLYSRDSIRLSFFQGKIENNNFRINNEIDALKNNFLGFITLRPTRINTIGRSVISPRLYKSNDFICCLAKYNVLINGVKLDVYGFPYCTQDGETLSCAETTVLNIMEYFGVKYNNYTPTLPSKISNKLFERSFERLIPTNGLNTEDISYALKELGFATKIYHKDDFIKNTSHPFGFKEIVNSYIDSGIPIIATITNDYIGHAVIIIGHEILNDKTISLNKSGIPQAEYYSDYIDKYLIIDDNVTPYQLVLFDEPTNILEYNHDESFKDCTIESVIVPLYHKVYVDSVLAHDLIRNILREKLLINLSEPYIIKIFLTSSRSFKSETCINSEFDPDIKELIVSKKMPKFIWIAELYKDENCMLQNNVMTLIVIDATEPNFDESHIIFIMHDNQYIVYNFSEKFYEKIYSESIKISTFVNNLKEAHCQWQS